MPLDAYGVAVSLSSVCPLDGTAGPYLAAGTSVYPDAIGGFWRLDFSASATTAQQQAAVAALAVLSIYVAPSSVTLTPYRLSGSFSFGATLAIGTTMPSVPVSGLLKSDTPMIAFGSALPSGIDVRAQYPDPTRDGYLILEIAVLSLLSATTTVPFTLIGVR